MHLLLDTNVLIPLEPTSPSGVEPTTQVAVDLLRLATEGGHRVSIHPASLLDLAGDQDPARRALRAQLIGKYASLEHPPSDEMLPSVIPKAAPETNDWVDNQLLAAVVADAVDYLITEDGGLLRKAARLGLQDRATTVAEGVATLATLLNRVPPSPPSVDHLPAHALRLDDPIFDSFRAEYEGYDGWLTKCRREGRDTWVIRGDGTRYGGLAIVKPEGPEALRLAGAKVLKLCSFKVAEPFRGRRYGELLLKTVFDYCAQNRFTHMYVEVFERHAELVALFEDFGFGRRVETTSRGEVVLAKAFVPDAEAGTLAPLDYHVRFGPPAIRLDDNHVFIVPIQPRYHRMLFPEAGPEITLAGIPVQPFGNAIRKAYLSNSSIRAVVPGDSLLFYRSDDIRAVTVLGVVERTVASDDPQEIAREVGQRTVYSSEQIADMCDQRAVLAILFRQDRILQQRISRAELERESVILRPPQTIAHVRPEGLDWLRRRIET